MNTTKHQRKGFWNFIFSWIPGLSEMYCGFLKMGISLLMVFFVGCALGGIIRTTNSGLLIFIPVLIWFYGFFHARNIAHMDPEAFGMLDDHFIWDEFYGDNGRSASRKKNIFFACLLIALGVVLIWSVVSNYMYTLIPAALWDKLSPLVSNFPQVCIAVLIIIVGIRMIRGKKEELVSEEEKKES